MKRILAGIIATLCIGSAAWAQYPTVIATVTTTADSVVYNYRLTNTMSNNILEFNVFAPGRAANVITSFTTSREGWEAGIARANDSFVCIGWHLLSGTPGTALLPGDIADFSFTTIPDVPTTSTYTFPGLDTNWSWYGFPVSGGNGNTILPVPAPVPEPASFVALGAGFLPLGTALLLRNFPRFEVYEPISEGLSLLV